MILDGYTKGTEAETCPHTRGDDPFLDYAPYSKYFLSPYAWG